MYKIISYGQTEPEVAYSSRPTDVDLKFDTLQEAQMCLDDSRRFGVPYLGIVTYWDGMMMVVEKYSMSTVFLIMEES